MINSYLIREKLDLIRKYYQDLEEILKYPLKEIKADFVKIYALERIFQLIVDEIIDINNHIIRNSNFEIPDDFQSTFLILSQNKVLPESFAKKIAPIVGLRNRLVHRYEKIDKNLFLKMLYKEKEDFKKYIKFIEKFLEK